MAQPKATPSPAKSKSFESKAEPQAVPVVDETPGAEQAIPDQSEPGWDDFVRTASDEEIRKRYSSELVSLVREHSAAISSYAVFIVLQPDDSISNFTLDQIYSALSEKEPREKDVLLVLFSSGGSIEPAYQISKICKAYSRERFVAVVPRQAKSAATLIAIGADEIHMGPLGQLGPIDPQLGGLPALGVTQALETIASMSQKYPASAETFARYLRMAIRVEQIGYSGRVSESAVQYAERLLSTKPFLSAQTGRIARELVYEYKDHGFVIDFDEAADHLGSTWIKQHTPETAVAEAVYRHFEWVNLFLAVHRNKRLMAVGASANPVVLLWDREQMA